MNERPTYEELLLEVQRLRAENAEYRKRFGTLYTPQNPDLNPTQKRQLSLEEKINLFMSLFSGRQDVYAYRWENKKGQSGYSPTCANEWVKGVCDKSKVKCAECQNRNFIPLTEQTVYNHLDTRRGDIKTIIGLYPIRQDNTVSLLCADFDDKSCEHGFREDVLTYAKIAREWSIGCYMERSRSGNGAHAWIFFTQPIPARKARQLGNAILAEAMKRRGQISLKSYDRFFPNQDELTEGGLGNLVALPLQGTARTKDNSIFVDDNFQKYPDQWEYLLSVTKTTPELVDKVIREHSQDTLLGKLSTCSDTKPWETLAPQTFGREDFIGDVTVTKANMLYVPLACISYKVVNHLKRVAAFTNQEFYDKQRMRMSTYGIPRIISCSYVDDYYIGLPRGCEESLLTLLNKNGTQYKVEDKRNTGHSINVNFKGELRPEQKEAVDALLKYDTGVLHATTAFGKTVAAIGLIAKRKVNTLILVHTNALLGQWKKRLEAFLDIDYTDDHSVSKRGRKRSFSPYGTLNSSSKSPDTLPGQIDIALIQSCINDSAAGAKDFVRNYGMVIVDECHHVSAISFETVLKHVNAKYVYGLTATPIRKDHQQPVIFMQCGPIRYCADAKKQIASQNFERILVPRFTSYRYIDDDNPQYTQITSPMSVDPIRNQLIVNDICKTLEKKRSPIILTSFREHVVLLEKLIKEKSPETTVITLIGSDSAKEKRAKMELLQSLPEDAPLAIVATDKYVGEGFDYPRLDTLFMTMPMSWKGRVQQCAGRLHRDFPGKKEVRIYDYIDLHIPVASNMYNKRLKGYAECGYNVISQSIGEKNDTLNTQTIFSFKTYFNSYLQDITSAHGSIVISMPKIWFPQFAPMLEKIQTKRVEGVSIRIYTSEKTEKTNQLQSLGLNCTVNPKANISFSIIDSNIVWYGNVNFLAHTKLNFKEEEHSIRIINQTLASSLMEHINTRVNIPHIPNQYLPNQSFPSLFQ